MTGERLSWLIRTLGSSGKELSASIGIDSSTMSKWRKGKRALRYDSEYAQRIADLAMDSDVERKTGVLTQMLREWQPSLLLESREQRAEALRLWLTLTQQPKAEPTSHQAAIQEQQRASGHWIGVEKMMEAQNAMFRRMYALPGKQEMIMLDFGAVDWSTCPHRLIEECVQENRRALENPEHSMIILDQLTDTYRPRELMFQWMPIYLRNNVQTYFYRNPKPLPLRQNILLIRGQAVLLMSSTTTSPARVLSTFLYEPEYVRQYEELADALIAEKAGMSVPEIFKSGGEERFRELESEVLQELGKQSGSIISTGGGCVTQERNYAPLHQNGTIFWLQRDLAKLATAGRPISLRTPAEELYRRRAPLYERFADETVKNDGTVEETVFEIMERLQ